MSLANSEQTKSIERFTLNLTRRYVSHPEQLYVRAKALASGRVLIDFPGRHAKADHGKLIGGHGINFRALEKVVGEYAMRFKQAVRINISEPPGVRVPPGEFVPNEDWYVDNDNDLAEFVNGLLSDLFPAGNTVRVKSVHQITYLDAKIQGGITPEMNDALTTLIRAIGKNNGREVVTTICAS